jgi:hypothetical protein
MKIATIPDLHGKDTWKKINPDDFDKIIFLGDYVDASYRSTPDNMKFSDLLEIKIDEENGKTDDEILENLLDIIELKRKYPEKIQLLLGNHDIPYYYYSIDSVRYNRTMCSGHRNSMLLSLSNIFMQNKNLFKIAYQIDSILWTHAGLTQSAYNLYFRNKLPDDYTKWADELNRLFVIGNNDLFHISHYRGGKSQYGSIFWAHIKEFTDLGDYNLPVTQIVGHNRVKDITCLYGRDNISMEFGIETDDAPLNVIFTDILDIKDTIFITEM